jgi:hypothetical protein
MYMVDVLDFTQEARGCLRLAECETQSELKTILMGMALGWLTLAKEMAPAGVGHEDVSDEPTDGPVEEPVDEPIDELLDEPLDENVQRH